VAYVGEERNAYGIMIRNMKGVEWIHLALDKGPAVGCCEHDNEI
jgi:hypothetical protein